MRTADAIGARLVFCVAPCLYAEPLSNFPPREGMRPGTAAGDPQTPF